MNVALFRTEAQKGKELFEYLEDLLCGKEHINLTAEVLNSPLDSSQYPSGKLPPLEILKDLQEMLTNADEVYFVYTMHDLDPVILGALISHGHPKAHIYIDPIVYESGLSTYMRDLIVALELRDI